MKHTFFPMVSRLHSGFEKRLRQHIDSLNIEKELEEPLKYVLLDSGKRVRPLLVLLIAEAIGKGQDVYPAAFCTEFFHTASLIADDLPCMDDDDERRGKASLHKVYDEETALLVSYGLISLAFEEIHRNYLVMKEGRAFSEDHCAEVLSVALKETCYFSGFKGAVKGQYFDLKSLGHDVEASLKINDGKTGALFVGTFVLGYLFGGGALDQLEHVKRAAGHFGSAFQIYDDIKDLDEDAEKRNLANIALAVGRTEARQRCLEHVRQFQEITQQVFSAPHLLNRAAAKYFEKIL
jgi:geranylgeranyl diphosphate synthase, type II